MSKLKQILSGWSAYISNDSVCLSIAKQRAEVCADCPHSVSGSFEQIMPDYSIKSIQGMKCDECGCPLSTATRSKDYQCPLKKW